MVKEILGEEGMKEALQGKSLVSICAGVPVEQLEEAIYGGSLEEKERSKGDICRCVRAMPNTASGIRESMTGTSPSPPFHYQKPRVRY